MRKEKIIRDLGGYGRLSNTRKERVRELQNEVNTPFLSKENKQRL